MDKRIILAVAGSGKTTLIVDKLDLSKRSLVITYTNNNLFNLRTSIIKKFNYLPTNIILISYFTFLHSFCYKPYLHSKYKSKGINYLPNRNFYAKKDDRFFDRNRRLYSNRISKLLEENDLYQEINDRISKYFDNLFIDEIQDFAGNDFNFLINILKSNIEILLVGDFYQHTFDTSRDFNVNGTLFDNYDRYIDRFKKAKIEVDLTSLSRSYRCSPSVCSFITKELDIHIDSHREDDTKVYLITDHEHASSLLNNHRIIKLFYQEHYKYNCYSRNWGDSKGEDRFNHVCVILNKKTTELYNLHRCIELPPQSKNKLYVACSRARGDLYLIPDNLL